MTYVIVVIAIGLFILLRAIRMPSSGSRPEPTGYVAPPWSESADPRPSSRGSPSSRGLVPERQAPEQQAVDPFAAPVVPPRPRAVTHPPRHTILVDAQRHTIAIDEDEPTPHQRARHGDGLNAFYATLYGPGLCSPR